MNDPVAVMLPGKEPVTYSALLMASYITVLTFADGEYGNPKEGTCNVGAFIFNVVAFKSMVVALVTVTSPLSIVEPVIVVDPEIKTGCDRGLMKEAVEVKEADTALELLTLKELVVENELDTAFRM